MDVLFTLLGLLGPISMVVALFVIALLSQRLGAVLHRAAIYRWFYLSIALIIFGIILHLFALFITKSADDQTAFIYDLPFAVGLLIAVIVAWRYWGWLLNERDGQRSKGT